MSKALTERGVSGDTPGRAHTGVIGLRREVQAAAGGSPMRQLGQHNPAARSVIGATRGATPGLYVLGSPDSPRPKGRTDRCAASVVQGAATREIPKGKSRRLRVTWARDRAFVIPSSTTRPLRRRAQRSSPYNSYSGPQTALNCARADQSAGVLTQPGCVALCRAKKPGGGTPERTSGPIATLSPNFAEHRRK